MINKVVFLGALPRAGSTLLMNILGQNPIFHVTATSGLFDLLRMARQSFTANPAMNAQDKDEMDARFSSFCEAAFWGWMQGIDTEAEIFIDKGRAWLGQAEFTKRLLKGAPLKIIAPIRDVRGIAASMEKLHRKTNLRLPSSGGENMVTVTERLEAWLNNAPIGPSMSTVNNAIQTGMKDEVCWVKLEDLTVDPKGTLEKIYEYLGIDNFEHDFDNIEQITHEDDRQHGFDDLHIIRGKLDGPCAKDWVDVIGAAHSKQIKQEYPWFYEAFYPEI